MALPVAQTAVMGTFYMLCMVLALTGNTVLLVAVFRSKRLRSQVSTYLLISVLIARDIIACCVIPVEMIALFNWEKILGFFWCKICYYMAGTSTTATSYSLALLGFERMQALKTGKEFFPTKWHFVLSMVVIWGASLVYNTPPLLYVTLFNMTDPATGETDWICGFDPMHVQKNRIIVIVDAIVACAIPLTIVLYSFLKTSNALINKIKSPKVEPAVIDTSKNERHGAKKIDEEDAKKSDEEHGKKSKDITINVKEGGDVDTSNIDDTDAKKSDDNTEAGTSEENPQPKNVVNKDALRTLEMSVVTVIIFSVCSLTPYILKILALWFNIFNQLALQIVLVVMFTNPWVTWIVFVLYRKDLRDAVYQLLHIKI